MTTLISLLGKSQANKSTGYRPATYRFSPDFTREVPFFGMGLVDYLKPDRLILMGTSGSMWDVFFDHQQTDEDGTLALIDAVASASVTPELLAIHEERLSEKYGIPVKCILIPYARDEAEQAGVLMSLAEVMAAGENVVLDVTHGFRHLPMLALVAARYLTHIRGVRVQEVYYGALEMTDPVTQVTPVLQLGGMLKMLDWVDALAVYENSGNYGVFGKLLEEDGMPVQHASMLAQGAFFERSNNPVRAKEKLSSVLNEIDKHPGHLGALFRNKLHQHLDWFHRGERGDWELALADRYLARKDYLRATIYMYEAFVSHAVMKHGGNINDHESREEAEKIAIKAHSPEDVWLLKNLRNQMAHGVRPRQAKNKSEERQNALRQRLLSDSHALDARLRELRKTLFRTT